MSKLDTVCVIWLKALGKASKWTLSCFAKVFFFPHLLGEHVLVVLDAFVPHRLEDGGERSHADSRAHQHHHLVTEHVFAGCTKRAVYGYPEKRAKKRFQKILLRFTAQTFSKRPHICIGVLLRVMQRNRVSRKECYFYYNKGLELFFHHWDQDEANLSII